MLPRYDDDDPCVVTISSDPSPPQHLKLRSNILRGNVWGDGMGEKMTVICFFFEYDNDGMYLWPWCLPYGHIVIWFIHSLIW